MQKIIKPLIITTVSLFILSGVFLKSPLVKYPVTVYLRHIVKSEVKIDKCRFSFIKGIIAKDVEIRNERGLYSTIKEASVKPGFGVLRDGLALQISLKDVGFSYSSSEVIKAIAALLGIDPVSLIKFNTVDTIMYIKKNETIIKDLKAHGREISLFADGTTTDDEQIDYKFKLMLSDEITSKIPEGIRMFFFKQEEESSVVELSVSGHIKKPSISFSTPLFKLRIK